LSREDWGFDENAIVDQWRATSTEFDIVSAPAQTEDFLRSDLLSQVASRSVLGWLRMDGYPPSEKNIFTHDWFDVGSLSEESAMSDDDSPVTEQSVITPVTEKSVIKEWLDRVDEIES